MTSASSQRLNSFGRLSKRYPPDWLLLLLLLAGIYLWQRTAFPLWMVDILPFQIAANHWESGASEWVYTNADSIKIWQEYSRPLSEQLGGEGFGNPYYYPPVVLWLTAPFSDLPAAAWMYALFGVNFLMIFVNAWFVLRVCDLEFEWRNYLWCLTLPLLAYPLSRATKLGQLVPLIAAMVWFGLIYAREQRWGKSGVMLGMASALKVFPIALILIPVFTRRWRLTAAWLGTILLIYAVSFVALGFEIHLRWWNSIREFGTLVYTFWGNQSLIGWYSRLVLNRDLIEFVQYTDTHILIVKSTITLIFGGVTVGFLWSKRQRITHQSLIPFAGFLFAGMLLSLANAWEHYWLFCLPVLGWALHDAWSEGRLGFSQAWIGAAAFFFLMKLTRFYVDSLPGRFATGSQTVGMVLLWLWLLWRLRKEEPIQIEAR